MEEFTWRSAMPASAAEVFAWHARAGAFERLMPPWRRFRLVERTGTGIQDGTRVVFELGFGPIWMRWVALHSGYQEGRQFRDEQIQGPFEAWQHTHRFVHENDDTSWLEDRVSYELQFSPFSHLVAGRMLGNMLEQLFRFRHERIRNDLERHRRYSANGLQTFALSGSSGLVGRRLSAFLSTGGHTVRRLVRPPAPCGPQDIRWNPKAAEVDAWALEGVDAVVHLAGESLAEGRWTDARKADLRSSRVESTRLLAQALAGLRRKPRVLICASAVGIYGDRGEAPLDERSTPGEGFLAELCQAWEEAADPARQAGIRVVHLRLGMVLAREGGALGRLALPFSLGLGGRLGNGRQAISWMSAEDVVGAIYQALFDPRLAGPVNAVAPQPVTNAQFTRVLARLMARPALLHLPAIAVKLGLGEMGEALLLKGARVHSARLQAVGFPYLYGNLQAALSHELGI
jgi:uncharacterized protein (TIGR01777 family)